MPTKLYQSELSKVQEQLDNIQENYVNGLISLREKVEGMLEYLDQYESDILARYKTQVTHDESTGLPKEYYSKVRLLDNLLKATTIIEYINQDVNIYL